MRLDQNLPGRETSLSLTLGQCSEAGLRDHNQDFYGAATPPEPLCGTKGVVVALADGIGSSAVSHVAAAAAVRGFIEDYYGTSEAWPVRRAAQCVLAATNSWLHAQTQRGEGRFDKDRGYVCTFSALVFKGRQVHLLHVGDARVYRVHPRALEPLTEDHRVRISDGEWLLGRALGAASCVDIDYRCWAAEPGEVYLLATDGAHEHLSTEDVCEALSTHSSDLDAAASAMVQRALTNGSRDNATVQLVRIDSLPEHHPLDAQRDRLAMPPALFPRMRFEGYTIVRELHASARSHVHLAIHEDTGQHVTLKTPAVEQQENAEHLDRFMLEEWIARRIDHPNVLRPGPTPPHRRHLYVVMEHVKGQTLRQWMRDHPRPALSEVRALVAQAAQGLQAFHRKEMIHGDLRPENLLVDPAGTVRLIDFGAVQVAGLSEFLAPSAPIQPAGALQYTAPECLLGEIGTPRSDLFSLAVLTYEMLVGSLPFGLETARIRNPSDLNRLAYAPLRALRPDLPVWLDAVLAQAMHPRAGRRQEVLSEFIENLHRPAPRHLRTGSLPLIERHPVRFWQGVSLLLAGWVIVLLLRP